MIKRTEKAAQTIPPAPSEASSTSSSAVGTQSGLTQRVVQGCCTAKTQREPESRASVTVPTGLLGHWTDLDFGSHGYQNLTSNDITTRHSKLFGYVQLRPCVHILQSYELHNYSAALYVAVLPSPRKDQTVGGGSTPPPYTGGGGGGGRV